MIQARLGVSPSKQVEIWYGAQPMPAPDPSSDSDSPSTGDLIEGETLHTLATAAAAHIRHEKRRMRATAAAAAARTQPVADLHPAAPATEDMQLSIAT